MAPEIATLLAHLVKKETKAEALRETPQGRWLAHRLPHATAWFLTQKFKNKTETFHMKASHETFGNFQGNFQRNFFHLQCYFKESYLWTGDFTTMYTMIPQEELIENAVTAAAEAFDWYTTSKDASSNKMITEFTQHWKSHCALCQRQSWHCATEALQDTTDSIFRQTKSIPKGRKATAEKRRICDASSQKDG